MKVWLRGGDLNPRPLGYEPNELPDCSTPRQVPENTSGDAWYHAARTRSTTGVVSLAGSAAVGEDEHALSAMDQPQFAPREFFDGGGVLA